MPYLFTCSIKLILYIYLRHSAPLMRIGFFMKWDKGRSFQAGKNAIGEELYFESMCKYLRQIPQVDSAELYAPNALPEQKLDLMVHVNDTAPQGIADKEVLYLQNGYPQGADKELEALAGNGYDGCILLSDKLLDVHRSNGHEGVCIPLGADTDLFHPCDEEPDLAFDVSYVGNDIKGKERTERYLLPAARFNLGLYGNWDIGNKWRNTVLGVIDRSYYPRYRIKLSRLTRGKIPQEQMPALYSSSKINLNITLQDAVDWDFWNLRPLEIMACGGFLLTDRFPNLEKEFRGGAAFTGGGAEMAADIEYFLENDNERRAIAHRGMEIVRERHSIKDRAQRIYAYLKLI